LNDLLPRVSPRTDDGIHQVKQNYNGRSGRVVQKLERRNGLFAAIFEKLEFAAFQIADGMPFSIEGHEANGLGSSRGLSEGQHCDGEG